MMRTWDCLVVPAMCIVLYNRMSPVELHFTESLIILFN